MPLSFWRFMWLILRQSSMSASALWPLANIADFISWDSSLNIRPSLRTRAMGRPSFSIKQPPWLNQTCMPCSTICPIKKWILRYGWNLQDVFDVGLFTFFSEWDIIDMLNGVNRVIPSFHIVGSFRPSQLSKPIFMRRRVIGSTRVDKPYIFLITNIPPQSGWMSSLSLLFASLQTYHHGPRTRSSRHNYWVVGL